MWHIYITMAAVSLVAGCPSSRPSGSTSKAPVQEITWTGPKGFTEWGQTTSGFFGVSAGEPTLQMWRWDGSSLQREQDVILPKTLNMLPLLDRKYLASISPGDPYKPWPCVLARLGTNEILKRFEMPKGWSVRHTGCSRSGKYACAVLGEDPGELGPPDQDWENPRYRIGLVDVATGELSWVAELRGNGMAVEQVTVSDDGKSIAVGGWTNAVALVDASLKKVAWIEQPSGTVTCGFVAFSSDGSTLYAADSGAGGVYALDVKTGKVLRKWCATMTGEDIYGQRISCLAVSPDDAWVAVGTGPTGEVFLFSTASPSGGKPILLAHGQSTTLIASFSPDSKYLATVAGGRIKIWEVPAPSKVASSSSRPAGN